MKLTPLLLLIPLLSGAALADPQCTQADKSKWMSEADAQQQIKAMGYDIKKFKAGHQDRLLRDLRLGQGEAQGRDLLRPDRPEKGERRDRRVTPPRAGLPPAPTMEPCHDTCL